MRTFEFLLTALTLSATSAFGQSSPEIKALIDSTRQYYYTNGEKTIGFAREALALSRESDDYWGKINALQMIGEGHFTLGNLDSAEYYYDLSLSLAVAEDDLVEQGHNYISKASINSQGGNYQKAIEYYLEGLRLHELTGDSSSVCDARLRLGNVYSLMGDHVKAIDNYLTSIRMCEAIENLYLAGFGYGALGIIHAKQKNYNEALKYYHQGLAVFEQIENEYGKGSTYNNLGILYKNMGQYDNAIEHYDRSLSIFEELGYKPGIGSCNTNLGILHVRKGQFEAALPYSLSGLEVAVETANRESEQDNYNTIAQAYSGLGDHSTALEYAFKSLQIAEDLGSREKLRDVNLTLSTIYEALGQEDIALQYFKVYSSEKDSLLNAEQSKQINELRTVYETEKKDQEIEILAKNAELDQVRKTRLWIGLGLTLLLAFLVITNLVQRRRKDQKIHDQQQEIERQNRRNAELEAQRLAAELDFKQKELTAKVLQLARKNDFLQGLNEQVHKLRDQSEGPIKDEARKLGRMINYDIETETDWDDFLASFKQVHSTFMEELTNAYPDLSKNDLKMACLMKMNLSSKEIASALNISPAGIKKARYRLRKKLDLVQDQDIQQFFISFHSAGQMG